MSLVTLRVKIEEKVFDGCPEFKLLGTELRVGQGLRPAVPSPGQAEEVPGVGREAQARVKQQG